MPCPSRKTSLAAAALALAAVPSAALTTGGIAVAGAGRSARSGTPHRPAVLGHQVIGHSVQGRPITAWHLGQPGRTKVVLMAVMHGNEPAARRIMIDLLDGPRVFDLDLWVIPVYNPDGLAHGTRRNARGVDLNRNYPWKWIRQTGNYDSGPRPASEPETRAMMGFLGRIRPAYVLSFHQPFHTVDVTERPAFSRRVARALRLPTSRLNCGSTCHGTMTMWFNHRYPGFALTVELGLHPSRARLRAAPDRLLRIWGAWRGGVLGIGRHRTP